jgi:hypothetical protein
LLEEGAGAVAALALAWAQMLPGEWLCRLLLWPMRHLGLWRC